MIKLGHHFRNPREMDDLLLQYVKDNTSAGTPVAGIETIIIGDDGELCAVVKSKYNQMHRTHDTFECKLDGVARGTVLFVIKHNAKESEKSGRFDLARRKSQIEEAKKALSSAKEALLQEQDKVKEQRERFQRIVSHIESLSVHEE